MCACVVKDTHATRSHRIVATLTNALKLTSHRVALTPFARIFQEATNVCVHPALTVTHSTFAKNATALNVSVNRHTSWSVATVFWLTARTEINVLKVLNASQSPVVLATVLVRKASVPRVMVHALILTNVLKTPIPVVMTPFVLTLKVVTLANVQTDLMESPIKVYVRLLNVVALLIENADQTRNACNLENVFVLHRSSLKVEVVKIHVKDFLAESTLNAVPPIHRNACAKQVSKEIHSKAVQAPMNVQMLLALMEPNASISKAATNASVQVECQEIPTKVDVFMKIHKLRFSVHRTKDVRRIFAVITVIVLAHALMFYAVLMLSANQKIMLDGAAAVSDSTRAPMETVFQVGYFGLLNRKLNIIEHY
jgi:hypothetical protein